MNGILHACGGRTGGDLTGHRIKAIERCFSRCRYSNTVDQKLRAQHFCPTSRIGMQMSDHFASLPKTRPGCMLKRNHIRNALL